MLTSEFDYQLPQNLIAQKPTKPRDHARLLVLNRKSGQIEHRRFYEVINYLEKGDAIVLNNSKVIPARLFGQKESTGGKIEIFLLQKTKDKKWQCLIRGKVEINQKIKLNQKSFGIVKKIISLEPRIFLVEFNISDKKLFTLGHTPLPPYIKKESSEAEYQTVYAKSDGSVAAPTAGLHFTKELLAHLKKKGIKIKYITLHVGLGTFSPVKVDRIEDHKIHRELAVIDKKTAQELNQIKKNGGRIIACGTTSVRTLEAFSDKNSKIKAGEKWVEIFIYPGYKFKFVDQIITNFHLPKSTLLMLISAFASQTLIKKAYSEAIQKKYKFFSFGDAMLIK